MDEHEWLAAQFEEHRTHLRAVAYKMLGSLSEADDAVQEGWLRLNRSDTSEVENLRAWLTTVVARVCLNVLRSRRTRGEVALDVHVPDPVVSADGRHIAFASYASNLASGDANRNADVFVRDTTSGVVDLVSRAVRKADLDPRHRKSQP